ncbi:MAG: substrate-binding domain-containing protein [Flavobacterium sp.]|jgi:phosphate transport system substrate-binding protein|nr:substrate-binding domain-containing protein [Flavobacterium sp.]
MKKFPLISFVFFLGLIVVFFACNQNTKPNNSDETILKGSTSVLVDETLLPIVASQVEVFESLYEAKIKINAKSEAETVLALAKDTSKIAILSRKLNAEEEKVFSSKKITPRTTVFATDAIAFISNKRNKDTLIALQEVVNFLKGVPNSNIKGLVFDNPNSSTVRYMNEFAGAKELPSKGVFSFKTNEEVIQFVAENEGMIGVVGVNWLMEPSLKMRPIVDKITILSVKGIGKTDYFAPTQNNLAEKKYPLSRDLYIINCQGYTGLGMGFASFMAGEVGQRITLKSGLLPVKMPGRNIKIRKQIEKEDK